MLKSRTGSFIVTSSKCVIGPIMGTPIHRQSLIGFYANSFSIWNLSAERPLPAEANRLNSSSKLLLICDSNAFQSRMSCLMND